MERSYSTDLSDAEWECLELHVSAPNKRGRPRTHGTREILNAVFFYVPKRLVRVIHRGFEGKVPTD